MARIEYNKLVRDRIPEIIKDNGDTCSFRELSDQEFKRALLDKLIEESAELLESSTPEEQQKEIADLFEVLDTYIVASGFDVSAIRGIQQKKREARGGFDYKIFLEWTE